VYFLLCFYSNNDGSGYVASLLRRQKEREIMFGTGIDTDAVNTSLSNAKYKDGEKINYSLNSQPQKFSSIPPPVLKPTSQYQHVNSALGYQVLQTTGTMNSRHSVLNHSVELDDILEESDCLDDEDVERSSSTGTGGESRASPQNATCSSSSPDISSSGGNPSPEGSFRGMLPPIIKRIGVNGLVNKYPQHHRRSRDTSVASSSSSKNISWCFEDADSAIVMERISSYPGEKMGSAKISTQSTEIEIKDIRSPTGRHYKQHRIHNNSKNNQQLKSHDSGFSDSADSTEDQKSSNSGGSPKIKASSNISPSSSSSISSNASSTSRDEIHIVPSISSSIQNHSISRRQNHNEYSFTNSSEEEIEHSNRINDISANGSNTSNDVRSEVVHETRTNAYEPHKQYHVSKVYFYSVSDMILNGEGTEEVEGVTTNGSDHNQLNDYYHQESFNHFIEDGVDGGESYVDTDFNDEIENEVQHVSILDCETGQSLLPRTEGKKSIGRNAISCNISAASTADGSTSIANSLTSRDTYNLSTAMHPPPPPQRISSLCNKDDTLDTSYDSIHMVKLDPNACDMILSDNDQRPYLDVSNNSTSPGPSQYYFMEHKPLIPTEFDSSASIKDEDCNSYNRGTSPLCSYFPESSEVSSMGIHGNGMQYNDVKSSRVYARTSSLGRAAKNCKTSPTQSLPNSSHNQNSSLNTSSSPVITSPHGRPLSSSRSTHNGSGFPKTNGALLYESLSLGRPSSRGITETKRGGLSNYNTLHDYHIQR
jgi:hypothetical protein